MSSNNGYEKYKKVDVSTASQNRLIVMLYDGAIKFLETACAAMDKNMVLKKHIIISMKS